MQREKKTVRDKKRSVRWFYSLEMFRFETVRGFQ